MGFNETQFVPVLVVCCSTITMGWSGEIFKNKILIYPPMLTTIVSLFVFESTDVGKNPLTFSV